MIRCALSNEPFWCLWGLFPGWAQWVVVVSVLLIIGGVAWRLVTIAKTFGGWPAALGALGLIGVLVSVVWPKRAQPDVPQYEHPDGEPLHPRSVKKARPTVLRQPGEDVKNWFERVTKPK